MVQHGARPFTPVFVGGTGRSGTTVLGGLIGQHHLIRSSMPREVKFITEPFGLLDICVVPERGVSHLPSRAQRVMSRFPRWRRQLLAGAFTEKLRTRWWSRENRKAKASGLHLTLNEDERDELLSQFNEDLTAGAELAAGRNFFAGLVRAQQDDAGEPFWVDTSPPNIPRAPEILELLPDARFIWVVRDGRNTAASVLTERWGADDSEEAIHWWETRLRRCHEGAAGIGKDRLLRIQLEELVGSRREETYERLCEFLGVSDDANMRAFFTNRMNPSRVDPRAWRTRVPDAVAFEASYREAKQRLMGDGLDPFEVPGG